MAVWLDPTMRELYYLHRLDKLIIPNSSSKSALHGLIHWLAGAYSKSGITVNGVAPALIQGTTMLPGNNEDLAKRELDN
jgi:NAD(P)-dependent dehydrogenase (short-subunit alcohol dehydrogenase family)